MASECQQALLSRQILRVGTRGLANVGPDALTRPDEEAIIQEVPQTKDFWDLIDSIFKICRDQAERDACFAASTRRRVPLTTELTTLVLTIEGLPQADAGRFIEQYSADIIFSTADVFLDPHPIIGTAAIAVCGVFSLLTLQPPPFTFFVSPATVNTASLLL